MSVSSLGQHFNIIVYVCDAQAAIYPFWLKLQTLQNWNKVLICEMSKFIIIIVCLKDLSLNIGAFLSHSICSECESVWNFPWSFKCCHGLLVNWRLIAVVVVVVIVAFDSLKQAIPIYVISGGCVAVGGWALNRRIHISYRIQWIDFLVHQLDYHLLLYFANRAAHEIVAIFVNECQVVLKTRPANRSYRVTDVNHMLSLMQCFWIQC